MTDSSKANCKTRFERGFSLLELVIVIGIVMVIAAIALPNAITTWYNMELRATGDQISSLMQQGRILAAKNNAYYTLCYRTNGGLQEVYLSQVTLSAASACPAYSGGQTPIIALARQITAASAAPSSNPTAYTYSADTTSGTPCDNACTLAFSPRGLPCNFITGSPGTCSTPASSYFVYYFQDSRPNGWSAVLVTKAGRTKTITWNGSSWN